MENNVFDTDKLQGTRLTTREKICRNRDIFPLERDAEVLGVREVTTIHSDTVLWHKVVR